MKWFERKFEFDTEKSTHSENLERLSATPDKLLQVVQGLENHMLEVKPNDTWSIKENIGHLSDLEPLWQGRLEDIMDGQEYLRPTDLENKKTDLALHNDKGMAELLQEFKALRSQTIAQLTKLSNTDTIKSALHPRLKTPMRVMDLFYFVAEHDDHHLARIREIISQG